MTWFEIGWYGIAQLGVIVFIFKVHSVWRYEKRWKTNMYLW